MPTLLEDRLPTAPIEPAERMRSAMTAARVRFGWLGVRKTLTPEQKTEAADPFDAQSQYLSASKKLIDTTHPAFQAVTAVKTHATAYWKSVSLPYPEPGLRLIQREAIDDFDRTMRGFREELVAAVVELDRQYADLREAARNRLGRLFNVTDYPVSLLDEFEIAYDFPSIEPPDYLRRLNPSVYESECRRVRARFEEAAELAEAAFQDELAKLVDHLVGRLNGADDGRPKRLHDSAVTNLQAFFDRFESLRVGSSEQLSELVTQARSAVEGVQAGSLRTSGPLRQQVATRMATVQSTLDQLLVDRPRRNIQRDPK